MVDVKQLATTARTHWWSGTDEIQLARAAREFECDLVLERRSDPEQARKLLVKLPARADAGAAVRRRVDALDHGAARRRIAGSSSSTRTTIRCSRCARGRSSATGGSYHDVDYIKHKPPVLYDLMAVTPRFRTTVKADFSVERVKFLRRPENRGSRVTGTSTSRTSSRSASHRRVRIAQPLSMGEFLRRHAELLMTRVVYWHGDVNRDEVARLLRDLRFVSETYGLVIPASMSRRALADLSIAYAERRRQNTPYCLPRRRGRGRGRRVAPRDPGDAARLGRRRRQCGRPALRHGRRGDVCEHAPPVDPVVEIAFSSDGPVTTIRKASADPFSWEVELRDGADVTVLPPGRDPYEIQAEAFLDAVVAGNPSAVPSTYADALLTDRLTRAVVAATGAPG